MIYTEALNERVDKLYDEAMLDLWKRRKEGDRTASYDSAEKSVIRQLGWTKRQWDQFWEESRKAKEAAEAALDAKIAEKLETNRKTGIKKITAALVASGLKYMLSKSLATSREELVDGLLAIGCNYTLDEVIAQFPESQGHLRFDGMRQGELAVMAQVIASARDTGYGRAKFYDMMEGPHAEDVNRFIDQAIRTT